MKKCAFCGTENHNGGYISSRMVWLNEKSLTDECDGINVTDGYTSFG